MAFLKVLGFELFDGPKKKLKKRWLNFILISLISAATISFYTLLNTKYELFLFCNLIAAFDATLIGFTKLFSLIRKKEKLKQLCHSLNDLNEDCETFCVGGNQV